MFTPGSSDHQTVRSETPEIATYSPEMADQPVKSLKREKQKISAGVALHSLEKSGVAPHSLEK